MDIINDSDNNQYKLQSVEQKTEEFIKKQLIPLIPTKYDNKSLVYKRNKKLKIAKYIKIRKQLPAVSIKKKSIVLHNIVCVCLMDRRDYNISITYCLMYHRNQTSVSRVLC